MEPAIPFSVVIFGPVGVGKSTVIKLLGLHPDTYVMREPIKSARKCGALQDVYDNVAESGYQLQLLILAERFSLATQTFVQQSKNPKTFVISDGHMMLDYSIFGDEHKRNNRMNNRYQNEQYLNVRREMYSATPEFVQSPDLYVFLDASPEVCLGRAARRDRVEETQLPVQFFHNMCTACSLVYKELQNTYRDVICIDTNDLQPQGVAAAIRNCITRKLGISK